MPKNKKENGWITCGVVVYDKTQKGTGSRNNFFNRLYSIIYWSPKKVLDKHIW